MIFADRDDLYLQPCQTVWGWLGDDTGRVIDSDGEYHRAMPWS